MKRALPLLLLAGACAAPPVGPAAAVPEAISWRATATNNDRTRLRKWRADWVKALGQARAAGHGTEIAAEGPLLDPDAALAPVDLAPGDYACRTIKLGLPDGS